MSLIGFLQNSLQNVHSSLSDALSDLTLEQAHWRPPGKGNHIAFVAWHYVRTEDNIIRFVLQRRPTVWMEGKWDQRFGLDSRAQGTGMSTEDAAKLRISDIKAFCTYMGNVWKETEAYLENVKEEDLQRILLVRPLGELPIERILGNTLLTHGFTHLGEIWALRGAQGMRGSPI